MSASEGGTVDVSLNANLGGEWQRSKECRDVVEAVAKNVAARASELAPDDPKGPAKDLHTSITGEAVLTEDGYVGRVTVGNFKGGWFEFGNSRHAARPFLRPAAEAAGLTFEKPGE